MTGIPAKRAAQDPLPAPAALATRQGLLRQLVVEAVRTALAEGARKAPDPIAFLRESSEEVTRVLALLEDARPADGASLRAILAEAVVAVAAELIYGEQPADCEGHA